MNLKKSLTALALGLSLATALAGTHGMAPAHASGGRGGRDPIGFPKPIIIPTPVSVDVTDTITFDAAETTVVPGCIS